MDKKCINCEFARYTEHNGQVGCGYWSAQYFKNDEYATDVQRNSDMYDSGLREAWLGWVFLKRSPHKETSDIFGEGMVTNNCVIINEEDSCNKYEVRQ